MTIVGDRLIDAENVSTAWLDAVRVVNAVTGRKVAVHLIARIRRPDQEVESIRREADWLVEACSKPKKPKPFIDTTRNTIFPEAWAARNPEPSDLAAYYRDRYTETGLRGIRANRAGTYFGRIVAYPRGDGTTGDQLSETVRKLRQELACPRPKSSRYEINIFSEALDKNPMSFPCLAHVSLHLHARALNMQAVYRNEYLVGRAYGNFLGLGQLLAYIATAANVEVGELLMSINHAELDAPAGPIRQMLDRLDAPAPA
jgi:Thymidylate synthase.